MIKYDAEICKYIILAVFKHKLSNTQSCLKADLYAQQAGNEP